MLRKGMEVIANNKKGKITDVYTLYRIQFDNGDVDVFSSPENIKICDVGGLIY